MKMKSLTPLLTLAASSVLPLSAQDVAPAPAPAATPIPEAAAPSTPAPVAEHKESAPAAPAMKLADINPALRAYLLETVACFLDGSAARMEEYASTGKSLKDLAPSDLASTIEEALKKTSTEGLPADIKPFVDGVVVILTQASTELAGMRQDMSVDAALAKYQAPLMELTLNNPAFVKLAMQLQGSGLSLMEELGLTRKMMMDTMILGANLDEHPESLPTYTAKLREIATLLRAKK